MSLKPKEIVEYIVNAGTSKLEKNIFELILQGIMAGMLIAIGAIGYFKVAAYAADPGLGNFFAAAVFPTGIMAILLLGAELFTSDCMAITGSFNKTYSFGKVFKMLIIVLLANWVGAIIISLLSTGGGIFSEKMLEKIIAVSEKKVNLPMGQMFSSAILCNIIVCSGVMMAYSAKDVVSKLIAIWFPIMVFVLSGTEHIVANMFYITMAYLNGGAITAGNMLYNYSVVAVGNFVGGAIIISGINALLYLRKEETV